MDLLCLLFYTLAIAMGLAAVRHRGASGLLVSAALLAATGLGLAALTPMVGGTVFGSLRALAWGIFLAAPLGLLAAAVMLRSPAAGVCAALLLGVGFDAFVWEPQALVVTHHTLTTDKLRAPLRLVVIADLQTDSVGRHERAALEAALAESPDLLLFPGDYLQVSPDDFAEQSALLNALMTEVGVGTVPFVAVRGDVDGDLWYQSFAGLEGHVVQGTRRLQVAGVTVTALDARDSRNPDLVVGPASGLHIVVGHAPDFALTEPAADVLVAGHTHGGQVVLPGYGPVMTLSRVPREQASGHTALAWGADLYVSRGVGMERRDAPRLRFLCRPEVMVIDLVPELSS